MKLLYAIKHGIDGYFNLNGDTDLSSPYRIVTKAVTLTVYKDQLPLAIYNKQHQILWLRPYAMLDPVTVFFLYQIALAFELDKSILQRVELDTKMRQRFKRRKGQHKEQDTISFVFFKEQAYIRRFESKRYQSYLQ